MKTGDDTNSPWTSAQLIAFRFLFAYLVLFFFPFPSGLVNPGWLGSVFDRFWENVVPWLAHLFVGTSVAHVDNGSSDTTFDYFRVGAMLALSAVITVVWSFLDRRRANYRVLYAYARIWLRYALALCMLTYGASKVLMIQFEPPGYGRLIEPVGELSPMALLWTFMGVSKFYTSFTGVLEVIGGLLLLSRRTTTLGALIAAGAMANVVMLNFAYDVPVKLGSLHILLLALVLVAPDVGRLVKFFVLNQPTEPVELAPNLSTGRLRDWTPRIKAIVVISFLAYLAIDTWRTYNRQLASRLDQPIPPEGWYHVLSLDVDGKSVLPLTVNDFRWKTISLRPGTVGVRSVDGSLQRFRTTGDVTRGQLLLYPDDKDHPVADTGSSVGSLTLHQTSERQAIVAGSLNGHTVRAETQRQNPGDFPLLSRGFRWISEAPYFR